MAEVPVRHPEATQPPAAGEEATELQLLLDRVKDLDEKKYEILLMAREIDEQKAEILIKIQEIHLNAKIPENIIIAFVEALVKANRYFDLKQYLRECRCFEEELDGGQNDICDIICEKIEKEGQFGNDEIAICYAVQAVRRELAVESNRSRRAEYEKRFEGRDMQYLYTRENLTTEEQKDLLAHRYPRFHKHDLEVTDLYARSSPILDLVYQIREKDYVMDEKPEEELQKIKKCNPGFYDFHFVYPEEPIDPMEYSDDTVALTNVPFYYGTRAIVKLVMDCGKVEGIHAERVRNSQNGEKCQVVFVTFEDSVAAKKALVKKSVLVDENLVEMTTPRAASVWLKPREVRSISNIESAVEKYNEFRNKYQKQLSGLKDVSSAACAGEEETSIKERDSPSKNEDDVLVSSDGGA